MINGWLVNTNSTSATVAVSRHSRLDCPRSFSSSLCAQVTAGSYAAVTNAIPEVALQYPEMCYRFMQGLPLKVLGEMEIPSTVAAQGTIVRAATSYTSYKEMWQEALQLDKVCGTLDALQGLSDSDL